MIGKYVIISPIYNEAKYIRKTIESVINQTIKPLLWILVDDGSTDETADIIKEYSIKNEWIHYIFREKICNQTYYSSNVFAILKGYEMFCNMELSNYNIEAENLNGTQRYYCKYLAILDSDISLRYNYYEQVLSRMELESELGIASGIYMDRLGYKKYRKSLNDRRSTPKAIMVFRRKCYEEIGGFIPMKYGGEDTCACFSARMMGWKTWSFKDIVVIHNKPIGMGHSKNILKIRFHQGFGEYYMASNLLFFILKCIRRCFVEYPLILGGITRLSGYIYAYFCKEKRQISNELIRYIHNEQLNRIIKFNSDSNK